ncbi:hypothetical protein X975_01681, partial [Stegodyphus mimosarum]
MYRSLSISEQAKGLLVFCDSKAAVQAILDGISLIVNGIRFRFGNSW